MKKIINGRKYDTETAELIFKDEMHHERRTSLYKKKTNEFFVFHETCWQNEEDWIEPIPENAAKEIVEIHCDVDTYERLFGEVEE